MLPFSPRNRSPLHKALWSAGFMVLVALAVRFGWGAHDPAMTWTFVAMAPVLGVFVYLQATGRHRIIAMSLIVLGLVALPFWILTLALGLMQVTGRADYVSIAIILAFPTAALMMGWIQLRKLARGPHSPPPQPDP